jgi:excisionase family DNA binding protein
MDGPDDMSSANFSSHFLTIAEVAAAMRVSKMTVYRLVKSHAIAAVRVGRSFRVPEEAVNDYIRRVTEPATQEQGDKKDDTEKGQKKDDTETD